MNNSIPKAPPAWKIIAVPSVRQAYEANVTAALETLQIEDRSFADISSIDDMLTDVTTALKSSADKSIPKLKFKRHLKPYWKEGLKHLHEKCRHFRKIWITQERPRDPNNAFFRAYKQAKRDFRKQLRRKAYEYESKEYERFENIFEQDRGAFQRTMST